jgi:predicted amidohydrolase
MKFRVALAQIKPILGDVHRNLETHLDYVGRAAEQQAD